MYSNVKSSLPENNLNRQLRFKPPVSLFSQCWRLNEGLLYTIHCILHMNTLVNVLPLWQYCNAEIMLQIMFEGYYMLDITMHIVKGVIARSGIAVTVTTQLAYHIVWQ